MNGKLFERVKNNFLGGAGMVTWAAVAVVVGHGLYNVYHK